MRSLIVIVGFSAVFWIGARNTGRWLINSWLHNSFYTHGIIVVLLCFGLIVLNGWRIKKAPVDPFRGLWYIMAGIILVFLGVYFQFRFLTVLSYIILCLGITRSIVPGRSFSFFRIPWLAMILVVPLPFSYEIAGYLQYVTARTAAWLLSVCFSNVVIDGVSVTLPPDIAFTIGLNCSGANSILALLTISIFWLIVVEIKPAVGYILAAGAVPVGFMTNTLRIWCIFVIAKVSGMDTAITIWHDWAGYFFYITSLSTMFFLWWIFHTMGKKRFALRRLIIP